MVPVEDRHHEDLAFKLTTQSHLYRADFSFDEMHVYDTQLPFFCFESFVDLLDGGLEVDELSGLGDQADIDIGTR